MTLLICGVTFETDSQDRHGLVVIPFIKEGGIKFSEFSQKCGLQNVPIKRDGLLK